MAIVNDSASNVECQKLAGCSPTRSAVGDPERSVDFLGSGHSLLGLGVGMILI